MRVEADDLDLVVEVADVTDDGLVLHLGQVLEGDDVLVARGSDVDVGGAEGVLDGDDAEAFHGGLESADRIDFGDLDRGAEAAERLGRALADVAVTDDEGDLAGDHDVGGALDAVDEGFAAAVEIVELRLRGGVVDVDGRDKEGAVFEHAVETLDAGGGLFRDALPALHDLMPVAGLFLGDLLEEVLDDLLFFGFRRRPGPLGTVLELVTLVDEERGVTAVVDDQLRAVAVGPGERLHRALPVFDEGLALPGEDREAGLGDRRGGMVLGGEDIAGGPAHIGAELGKRLNKDGRLDGHVQRTRNADALKGLLLAVLLAQGHQARHLVLGNLEFLAAPFGEAEVGDFEVGEFLGRGCEGGGHVCREFGVVVGYLLRALWKAASFDVTSQGRPFLPK